MSSPSLPLSSSSGPPPRRRNSDPTSVPSAESTAQYGITRLLTEKPAVAQLAMKLMRQGFSAPDALRAAHILDEGSKDTPACAPTGSAPPPPSTPAAIPARQRAGSVPASPSPEKSKRRRQVYDSDEDTPRARQRLRAHSPLESDALPFKINPEATNTADINELWPAASAVRKVKRYEYVDLWFFTAEGCKEAQKSRDDGREDAMVVMADGSLKRANTASGSRLDWHLTTHEFSSAVTTWVRVAKRLNLDSGIIASMKSLNEQILEHPDWATSPHDLMEWHSHQRKAWPNLRADGKRFPLDKLELVHYFKIQMRTSLNASSTALRQSQARAHGPPAAAPATLPPPQPTPRFQPPSRPPTQPRVPIQSAPTQGSSRDHSARPSNGGLTPCLRCGSRKRHTVLQCAPEKRCDGSAMLVEANPRSKTGTGIRFRDTKESVCTAYNTRACREACRASHRCTGCGGSGHGHIDCTSAPRD